MSQTIHFEQFESEFSIPKEEEKVMKFWNDENIYQKQRYQRKDGEVFNSPDGPPFVSSSKLHWGHGLVSFSKSTIKIYKAMTGYNVLNKLGFDTHGLPIEQLANKHLGLNSRQDIIDYGVSKYITFCKKLINDLSGSWKRTFERLGRHVDYDNQYKTMDFDYMNSCWWVFSELWKKGLIYRGFNVMHFSTGLNTPLSNSEVKQNYKTVTDNSVYVRFKVVEEEDLFLVAWTTTPWTLPSNLALAVNPNLNYCIVKDHQSGMKYIVGEEGLGNLYVKPKKAKSWKPPYTVVESGLTGNDISKYTYEPLYSCFQKDRTFNVVLADYVTADSGTGIVHNAPSFGQEDFNTCVNAGIVTTKTVGDFCTLDEEGKFNDKVPEYQGVYFKDVDKMIIQELKTSGHIIRVQPYNHDYPYCWRSDTPLVFMAVKCFFIDVPKLQETLLDNNSKINWIPEYIGSGRVEQWLKASVPWCISRSRIFGTPLPVFISDDEEEMVCVRSAEELAELAGLDYVPEDIHLDSLSDITIPSKMGKGTLKLVGDVLDCWFESGCVPFAQNGYPYKEDTEEPVNFLENDSLSDLVCEGIDQCTCWFYNLNVISTALTGKSAFSNVMCAGLVLAKDGKKFSKRLSNFASLEESIDRYGSDALRLYLVSSPASHGGSFKFVHEDAGEAMRRLFQTYNVTKFFIEQAVKFNLNGFSFKTNDYKLSNNVMDRWILARINTLTSEVRKSMDSFEIYKVYDKLTVFIEDLANWYIKFNRSRMKGHNVSQDDQAQSLSTCWNVLYKLSLLLTPFAPFMAETLYQKLKIQLPNDEQKESVLLCDYPHEDQSVQNSDIERKMTTVQDISNMVRQLRNSTLTHTGSRVPIELITVVCADDSVQTDIEEIQDYLMKEINCLNVKYEPLGDNVTYVLHPNHREIGQTFRKDSTLVKKHLAGLSNQTLSAIISGTVDSITVDINGHEHILDSDYYKVNKVISYPVKDGESSMFNDSFGVVVDFTMTEKVMKLYNKSTFVYHVQQMRKSTKPQLLPWDKIGIYYNTDSFKLLNTLKEYTGEIGDRLEYPICDISELPMEEANRIIIKETKDINGCVCEIIITDATGEYFSKCNG